MRKQSINNPRFPHFVRILKLVSAGRYSEEMTEIVVYDGKGRCSTSGAVEGQKVDISHRTISIPVRFDEWKGTIPSDGDTVKVRIGNITETMTLKDFEPDNNRTVLYCERNGNLDE